MKRYKDNAAVVHAWAGRHSDNGQNPNESIFFSGLTIYSYGYHFPMARHISFNDVLLTYATYSSTTSRHQSDVWRAVSHKNTIYVHDVLDPLGKKAVEETIYSANELLKAASKRRSKDKAAEEIHSAWQEVENLYEIAAFDDFKKDWKKLPGEWKRKLGALRKLIAECKLDASTALANMGAKELAAQKRAKAAAQKKLKAMVADATKVLEEWLEGGHRGGMHNCQQVLGTDGLRLGSTGLTVDTTQGLVVPADDCRRAWPLIKRFYDSKYSDDLVLSEAQSQRFGNFQLSRIDKDGTVVVGCHRFKRWMVERLASQLGLTV